MDSIRNNLGKVKTSVRIAPSSPLFKQTPALFMCRFTVEPPRGGRIWKRDQHSIFFFRVPLDPPPTPTFLIEYVFPMLIFSEIFFYINYLFLSMALCGIRFTTRACPVTRHELIVHASGVKRCQQSIRNSKHAKTFDESHAPSFATSHFIHHHRGSLFLFIWCYLNITLAFPINLGPFLDSSRSSSASAVILRLAFVGF